MPANKRLLIARKTEAAKPFSFRTVFVGALLLFLSVPKPGQAQMEGREPDSRGFIQLKVTGPLSEEARYALSALIEPVGASQLIDAIATVGTPVKVLCAARTCSSQIEAAANQAARAWMGRSTRDQIILPTAQVDNMPSTTFKSVVLIDGNDPILKAAGNANQDTIAVPQSALTHSLKLDNNDLAITPLNTRDKRIAVVDTDLESAGASERTFRLNRRLREDEIAPLIENLKAASPSVSVERVPHPFEAFSFIQFQTAGGECASNSSNWPFDVGKVVKVMQFNDDIRKSMLLGPLRRSRILIVDTGLGRTLAHTAAFNNILYADPAESLTRASSQVDLTALPECSDANENHYRRDVYGAGSGETDGDFRCRNPLFDQYSLLQPYARKPTSTQIYNPDHGSFVGSLAAGGPDFIKTYPKISDYLGLSFFRVTRESDDATIHVRNERSAIRESLTYASAIGADVINMSLKTDDAGLFGDFNMSGTALLVTSAGNEKEELDRNAPQNRPASMDMGERMIVVGALQNNASDPFWADSARSPSRVHIAAPGASISSLDAEGRSVCDSGTSAAAPLVSFVAATIKALTGAPRMMVRARVLASADHLPKLNGLVEDSRRLNVEAALDVFVDRIEVGGKVIRGWIEPDSTDPLVRVCQRESGAALEHLGGKIDPARLWEWWKTSDGEAAVRYQGSHSKFESKPCKVPEGTLAFFDKDAREVKTVNWSEVTKLLPTPFRAVKTTVTGRP